LRRARQEKHDGKKRRSMTASCKETRGERSGEACMAAEEDNIYHKEKHKGTHGETAEKYGENLHKVSH
jgi:hypothetical protein